MGKKKILNDPIYGIISFPHEITYELMDHPWVQRLRRISQMGLSHYVYPGAVHTRFHHAIGSLHLMTRAIYSLRDKGVEIDEEEAKGLSIAILLHDIGHGPFSHALEYSFLPVDHESISLAMMQALNREYHGELDLAIEIFTGRYHKSFMHELVSSQLDMDRMDYLNRDSFFTGVAEGVIGYDRLIKMLHVHDNRLVVEEKGIYSVEKFIMARRLMYWQVYLHKTSVATEQMLLLFVHRLKEIILQNDKSYVDPDLEMIFKTESHELTPILPLYASIDDINLLMALKTATKSNDPLLRFLSHCLLERKLFKIKLENNLIPITIIDDIRERLTQILPFAPEYSNRLVITGIQTNNAYNKVKDEIHILNKDGRCEPYSQVSEYSGHYSISEKYFVCFPQESHYPDRFFAK